MNIDSIFEQYWKPGCGSISKSDTRALEKLIKKHKPKYFLEIGTASGMSTAFISGFMSRYNSKKIVSVDFHRVFFADKSKQPGYLLREIFPGDRPEVEINLGMTSLNIASLYPDVQFDMIFIDGNHQHPWPTIDTIALLPRLKKGGIIIHHDLDAYKFQNPVFAIGPKFLYDQLPEQNRMIMERNMYYIKVDNNYRKMEDYLSNSMFIPWTLKNRISDDLIKEFRELVNKNYSQQFSNIINQAIEKFH